MGQASSNTLPTCLTGNLELQYNFLGGNIPLTLFNNVNLTTLSLDNNQLVGTIPEDLGRLTILRTFEVGGNQLVGSLPESIYTLPKLQKIRIEDTGIGGLLSERLIELNETLGELNAANTGYAGRLPLALSQLPELSKCSVCAKIFCMLLIILTHLTFYLHRLLVSARHSGDWYCSVHTLYRWVGQSDHASICRLLFDRNLLHSSSLSSSWANLVSIYYIFICAFNIKIYI